MQLTIQTQNVEQQLTELQRENRKSWMRRFDTSLSGNQANKNKPRCGRSEYD